MAELLVISRGPSSPSLESGWVVMVGEECGPSVGWGGRSPGASDKNTSLGAIGWDHSKTGNLGRCFISSMVELVQGQYSAGHIISPTC